MSGFASDNTALAIIRRAVRTLYAPDFSSTHSLRTAFSRTHSLRTEI